MTHNSPDPELGVVNVPEFKSVDDGCSISLLQKLIEVESSLAASSQSFINHDQKEVGTKLFKHERKRCATDRQISIRCTVYLCISEEILTSARF